MQLSRSPHRRGLVKVGCAALLVIVVLAMAAGFWVALSWRGWAAEASRRTFAALIEKTGLPDEQKQGMIAHVDALTAEFEAGTVSLQDMAAVVEQVSRSPIIPAAVVAAMHEGYVRQSALSDEEKAEAKVVLRRYARGVYEKSIPESAIGPTLEPISAPRGDSNVSIGTGSTEYHLKDPKSVTPDELRAFIANAKAKADEAGVPEAVAEVDFAAELGRAIDAALGRGSLPTDDAEPVGGD